MPPLHPLLSLGLAAAIAAALAYLMVKTGWEWALDVPGERSLHAKPVPRTGGIGIIAGVVAAAVTLSCMGADWLWPETMMACGLCAISLIDDKRGLPVTLRLSAHFGAALLYVAFMIASGSGFRATLPAWLWIPLGVLTMVAMSNFYNFMDGSNGLAGGMTLIGFGAFAAAAVDSQPALAMLCLSLAGGGLGFLLFNWQGRIFMGDGGSVPLGFLAASLGLYGWLGGAWTFWFPALVFAPFIVDASVTLLRRGLRGDRVWQAHREHYYQRVVRMGVAHGKLALGEYALMLVCVLGALASPRLGVVGKTLIFATITLLFLFLMLLIDARWRRHRARQPS